MMSHFHRNLLLSLLALGVVLQAFAVYAVVRVVGGGYQEAQGKDTANLAGIAARAANTAVLEAVKEVQGYDVSPFWPVLQTASPSLPQPIADAALGAERRYLVSRDGTRILWTNLPSVELDVDIVQSSEIGRAVASASTESIAVVPNAPDRSIVLARQLPPSDRTPVGYLVVAVSAESILTHVLTVFGQTSDSALLLADSSRRPMSGSISAQLPNDLYTGPFAVITIDGQERLAAAARVGRKSAPDALFVVVTRDQDDVFAPYRSAIDSVLGLEILLLGLVIAASFGIARRFAAPIETLRKDLEIMIGANPAHRVTISGEDEVAGIAQYVNRLADLSNAAKADLEQEAAKATRTIAFEQEKLAAILFSLSDGVIVCDHDLRVVLCNKSARHLLTTAWKPARRGRGLYAYLDAARLKPLVDAVGDKSHAVQQGTFTLATGSIIHATAVAVGDGEERNFIFLLRDITLLVNLDRQRNRAVNDTLERLRSPLSSLVSFTDILLDNRWLDDSRRQHFLQVMCEEAGRLSETLNEMQAQAEATQSPIEWSMEQADLSTFAREAVEELRSTAEQRLIHMDTDGGAAVVRGDILSLRQLIHRLFEFCLGFAAEGGRVEAHWQETEDGWLEFQIGYEGRALSPEEMESIFENPLYIGGAQEGMPRASQVATIREIIKQHGGEVWAKNAEAGAYLAFILPAKVVPLAKGTSDGDTVGKQVNALLGDGAFYDFRVARAFAGAARAKTPLEELSCVVFDLETTGLYPRSGDEVISIAGIRIERGEIVKEDYYYSLVNPRRPIPLASTRVHGITDEMVADQPVIEDVLPKFLEFQGASLLAGHFIAFDLSFLEPTMAAMELPARTEPTLDTLLLCHGLFKDWEGYNLEDLASHLGIKVVARHTALGDAYVTAQILLQLFKVMRGRSIGTLGDALRLQSKDIVPRFLHLSRTGKGGEPT